MFALTTPMLVAALLLTQNATAQENDHPPPSVNEERQLPAEDREVTPHALTELHAPDQQIDPRIYGAMPVPARRVDPQSTNGYAPPTPVPVADAFKGSSLLTEGEANREIARRETASTIS